MGYLVITRRAGEGFQLSLEPGMDPAEVVAALQDPGIFIELIEIKENQVRLSVKAQDFLRISRSELMAGHP